MNIVKILVIGGSGMLGTSIMLTNTSHSISGTYLFMVPNSKKMNKVDITKYDWLERVIKKMNPDVIINVAAVTNVDEC